MFHFLCRSFVFGGFDGVLASVIIISAAVGKSFLIEFISVFSRFYMHFIILVKAVECQMKQW